MSQMGNELERLLDENKYEMWEALRLVRSEVDIDILPGVCQDAVRDVLSKIENEVG